MPSFDMIALSVIAFVVLREIVIVLSAPRAPGPTLPAPRRGIAPARALGGKTTEG